MTPELQDPLSQLRDIHLPEPVSIWPPAPGWWLLAALILAAIIYGLYRWLLHRRHNRYRQLALQKLATLTALYTEPVNYLQALNELLKQTALVAAPSEAVASLTGQRWLIFLDNSGQTNAFTNGAGKLLLVGPYVSDSAIHVENAQLQQLQQLAERWIRQHSLQGVTTAC